MNLASAGLQVLQTKLSFTLDLRRIARRARTGLALEPADGRVVIMCAGVDDDVAMIVVREVVVVWVAAESELQNTHAGKTEIIAQRFNVGRDDAEVFGDDGQFAESLTDGREEFPARRFDPAPALGCLVAARYLPAGGEAAKVIYAKNVDGLKRGGDTRYPPAKTVGTHALPVVQRIPPELARRAEVIGRHARNHQGHAPLIQLELFRVCPHVG